jgi:signal transduction histidine kinase
VGVSEGLAGNYATAVAADRSGDLWLGTWRGGLYRLRQGVLDPQPVPLPVLYFTVRALAFDRKGQPWIGNWEGLFAGEGRGYRRYAAEPNATMRRISVLQFDRTGGLWVGTADQGLFYFPAGRPAAEPAAVLEMSPIHALLEDSRGMIWVGTGDGVGRFRAPRGGAFQMEARLGDAAIESLFEDSKGRVWATTAGGILFVSTPQGNVILDHRHGMPAHALYRVLEDDAGSYWISSSRGILELPRDPLEAVLAGERTRLEILHYGLEDGMRTSECHGLSQPAGGKARDGSLWFPTARGFVQIRPGAPRVLAPPAALIEEARTDAGPLTAAHDITLEAGARNLEVRFTALRFASPQKVEFRYRMGGFDLDWVAAGADRSARYNQLPPGRHVLAIQARDPGGAWGREAWLAVTQRPRFHQTWWFLALLGAASIGAVVAIYRWRLHAVAGRYAAVLEERNRIGREWHDTLVAGFSAISLQLEAAMARLADQPQRSSEILAVTKRMVHHYRAEARRVIWDLRDSRPEGETLRGALESTLERAKENRTLEGAVTVSGEPVDLPADVQHNLLRICQEAMSNALRHGLPTRVDVEMVFEGTRLLLSVRDNGHGFAIIPGLSESPGHFGLTVMQERARRIGAAWKLESRVGEGTVVKVELPLRRGETA